MYVTDLMILQNNMNEFFEKILDKFPWSDLQEYWSDHCELFLKEDASKGWIKVYGTQKQVKNTVNLIILAKT